MNTNQNKITKKVKWIASAVIAAILIIGIVISSIVLNYQPEPQIDDRSNVMGQSTGNIKTQSNSQENTVAKLNQNIKPIEGDEAQNVNNAITKVELYNDHLNMHVKKGTKMDDMSENDIFFLEGGPTTPLGESYIGRVIAITTDTDGANYSVETPSVDEVFDDLAFNLDEEMTNEKIAYIEPVDGVTISKSDDLSPLNTYSKSVDGNVEQTNSMIYGSEGLQIQNTGVDTDVSDDAIIVNFDLDLLKIFGIKKDKETQKSNTKKTASSDKTTGGQVKTSVGTQATKVYKTKFGHCYHCADCRYIKQGKINKTNKEITLGEADKDGLEPCLICNPPLLNGVLNEKLELSGKIGIEGIHFVCDYDKGDLLNNLRIGVSANMVARAALKTNVNLNLSGRTTTLKTPYDTLKIEGLKEKLFPLLFVGYNSNLDFAVCNNQQIKTITGRMPLTIGIVVYADIDGNITVGATAHFDFTKQFAFDLQAIKDGKWVMNFENGEVDEPKTSFGIDAEAKADVDACLGADVALYIFNVNVLDVSLAKVGAEGEGSVKFLYEKDLKDGLSTCDLQTNYYVRGYLKLLDIDVNFSANVKTFFELGCNFKFSHTVKDITLFELGEKSPTHFDENTMSNSQITASDKDYYYYKDEKGAIVREKDNVRETIYDEGFFIFCGIDKSYLYFMKQNEEEKLDVYRLKKDGSTNKRILENVAACHLMDDENLYYTPDFNKSDVYKLNRETLESKVFVSFPSDESASIFIKNMDDSYYAATNSTNMVFALLGGGTQYYKVSASGDICEEYGEDISIDQYLHTNQNDNYIIAEKLISSGFLRNTAAEIYIEGINNQYQVLTEGVSGWNSNDDGIITTQNSAEGADKPYTIYLYRKEDGKSVKMTTVDSNQAFFTLCKSNDNNWYFFDQNDTELTLCELSSDFKQKQVIKTFPLDTMNCNLESCGMTIMNNRIYFFSIDGNECTVIYRYDVI